jgi:hypothetical protein
MVIVQLWKLDPYPDAVIHYMTHNKDGSQILQTQGAIALITELLNSWQCYLGGSIKAVLQRWH